MTTSIILGCKQGSKIVQIVSQPLPPREQNAKFKELSAGNGKGFGEIFLHEIVLSQGRKRKHFRPPVR